VKLIDALRIVARPQEQTLPEKKIFLACGFTPLHLQTFFTAEQRELLPGNRITVKTGLFGDLCGSLERLSREELDYLVAVVEWADLDQRLALRTLGGWLPSQMTDVVESAARTAARLQVGLSEAARRVPTIVCMPTLPIPPMFATAPSQAGRAELQLRQIVTSHLTALSQEPGIRIASSQAVDEESPIRTRYDVKSDIMTGFPYTLPHASGLAKILGRLVQNRPQKKGLITDLDDTLWAGILGEDGVDGISWQLDRHSHMHGVYQQFLSSLAGAGTLVGVASKNDPDLVKRAFRRSDLLLSKDDVFPFEAHWSRKSESVQRILQAWNIAADAVVFIDDSPMELAEVKTAFPEMECIAFPKSDYQGVWNLLKTLREIFGKPSLTEDDAIRLRSIREADAWRSASQSSGSSFEDFLKNADATVVFEPVLPAGDARAFELVNKTNQFNLNGKRYGESEWNNFLKSPGAFVFSVSYKDRYGALGKIAVFMGKTCGRSVHVCSWVMSCRAFSRRIEHQCLKYLLETIGADEITFDFQATPRNGPLQELFADLVGGAPRDGVCLSKKQLTGKLPSLFHQVEGTAHV
jgi:FkbH-like protein